MRLRVPAVLRCRSLVLAAVRTGCSIARSRGVRADETFARELASAVGEAFNNVVLHGYAGKRGDVELDIAIDAPGHVVTVTIRDRGRFFDIDAVPPLAEPLPESGMGVHIMRSYVDQLAFEPGDPNVLVLSKRAPRPE
jgi:serine/threonine-protein kinase RsbW